MDKNEISFIVTTKEIKCKSEHFPKDTCDSYHWAQWWEITKIREHGEALLSPFCWCPSSVCSNPLLLWDIATMEHIASLLEPNPAFWVDAEKTLSFLYSVVFENKTKILVGETLKPLIVACPWIPISILLCPFIYCWCKSTFYKDYNASYLILLYFSKTPFSRYIHILNFLKANM